MTDLISYSTHNGGDFKPAPFRVVASWPAPAFAENVAVGADGSVFVTVESLKRVDRYNPSTGEIAAFAELPAPPMGLAIDASGALWVTGGAMGTAPGYVWKISPKGEVQPWTDIPDATFMNGCAIHPNGRELLVCESRSSRVLSIDMREPGKWSIWLEHEQIGPGDDPMFPGANGIKIRQGEAWVTVSARRLMVRVPILADGSAGEVREGWPEVLGDDFAFGASGGLYVATHPAQTVVKIEPSGARTTIAGPDQGVVGATAVSFGRAPGDEHALYVSTNGGVILPHEDVVQDAKLVRLAVGEAGYPLLGER